MEVALNNKEFFVMYQPKIDLASEKIVGAEALVRWQSPELGFMPPNSFVPLFERNNFIIKLDFYVYEQVFKFIRKNMDSGKPMVPISVNVSRNHDKPDKFVHDFMKLLKKYDIPPTLIEVELLERATLDKNLLRDITVMLQKEGFRVAMDDFGSGESSLNMLSTIPVNILKFDRSFLFASDAVNGRLDETSETFIETLVGLGKNLKKETIFEGVETEEQRDFLKKIKCDQVQGYFYSKPLREEEFMEFLKKHR
jgi:EAL domain-containing protein (putative c-di-GMP-specific phosphodiesterase class I)